MTQEERALYDKINEIFPDTEENRAKGFETSWIITGIMLNDGDAYGPAIYVYPVFYKCPDCGLWSITSAVVQLTRNEPVTGRCQKCAKLLASTYAEAMP